MQFIEVRTDIHTFKKGEKRDFRKNDHLKMAAALQRLDQIKFSNRQLKGLQKIFRIPVAKCFYIQNSIFGVFLKKTRF